jgi:hypothetical protein
LALQRSAQSPVTTTVLSIDEDDDEEARFQADLACAIAASKRELSPATSIASLSSDPSQIIDLESVAPSTVGAQSSSNFLRERAQLERERLTRLKRLRGEPYLQSPEAPSKRPALSREVSSAPKAGTSRQRGREAVGGDTEVFWDGELRQTANAHVGLGHNGEDGRPVFRLSQIIGDVSLFFYLCSPHLRKESDTEIADRTCHHLDVLPPAFLDLYLFLPQHSRCTCDPTCAIREWEYDHKGGSPKLDSSNTLLTRWTWRDAHEGSSYRTLLVDVYLMVLVFITVLSIGKITRRCINRQSYGSRLAGY